MIHGTASAYTNHRCRCAPCRAANAERARRARARAETQRKARKLALRSGPAGADPTQPSPRAATAAAEVTPAMILAGKRRMSRQLAARGWPAYEIASILRISSETAADWIAARKEKSR
jgi:hypothetical protein